MLSTHNPVLFTANLCPPPHSQGKHSIHVYSVNGCLLSSFTSSEQVTSLHLVSDYIILGTRQGRLHIRDLLRCTESLLFARMIFFSTPFIIIQIWLCFCIRLSN